ncbi:unnamed protein product [Triticum turgidum subsp. durum]|uniref:F-box protein At3g26010-like beta-propeller domain-containing protein n=1 Tax=Triticum turgidum subsp. durum TaxID=4567 RepID=A0A9R0R4Q4_TRITD|nr:unnamed protein product [Triticum turgidum subsp. durum]
MPPGGEGEGEGEGENGITVQSHPPATVRRDEDAPPHSTPPLPDVPPVASKDQEVSHNFPPSVYLGFEAAVPSRFLVFATPYNADRLPGQMAIYSSETGQWTYVQTKWPSESLLDLNRRIRVFLNGTMHLNTRYNYNTMLTVDAEGKVWREIPMPSPKKSVIFCTRQSQGRLYAWQMAYRYGCELYIWVLEDYGTGKWARKHTVNVLELFGRHCRKDGQYYEMFAFHPDCNVIFLTDEKEMTVSYDMDSQKNCNQLVIEYECSITCSAWDNTCCEN